jgi:hypothetical protein
MIASLEDFSLLTSLKRLRIPETREFGRKTGFGPTALLAFSSPSL